MGNKITRKLNLFLSNNTKKYFISLYLITSSASTLPIKMIKDKYNLMMEHAI